MNLGETLKKARERKDYSLREVESRLSEKNIRYTHTNIKRIEDGESEKIPIKVLSGLCEIYKLDKINILNLAGANIEESNEADEILRKGSLLFNNQNIDEESKKKILETLTQMFYTSKLKNLNKE